MSLFVHYLSLPYLIEGIWFTVMVTALGDVTSATRVAAAVDAAGRVPPLQFFQAVPNAVAGHLAARWQLTGPVVCVSGTAAGLAGSGPPARQRGFRAVCDRLPRQVDLFSAAATAASRFRS